MHRNFKRSTRLAVFKDMANRKQQMYKLEIVEAIQSVQKGVIEEFSEFV
jgi:hypothetical protein